MGVHFPFSPSAMHRKAVCSASHLFEQQFPEEKSGDAAIDGTHTHTLLEAAINQEPWREECNAFIGQTMQDEEGEFTVDQDRVSRVNLILTYVRSQRTASSTLIAERLVNPTAVIGRNDGQGTADITHITMDWVEVIDLKDGRVEVNAVNNWQGLSYMLGVLVEGHPNTKQPYPDDFKFRFTIYQPKVSSKPVSWTVTAGWLRTVGTERYAAVISRCEAREATFNADPTACKWCRGRHDCKTRTARALELANLALASAGSDTIKPLEVQPVGVKEVSDSLIYEVLFNKDLITGLISDLLDEGMRRTEAGHQIEGTKLTFTAGKRAYIKDQDLVKKRLLSMVKKGTKERIWSKKDLVVEKLIPLTSVLGNPNLSDQQKDRINKEFLVKPPGKKKLVLDTARGDDVSPAANVGRLPAPGADALPSFAAQPSADEADTPSFMPPAGTPSFL